MRLMRGQCGAYKRSMWDRCDVDESSTWGRCEIDVGCMRDRCEVHVLRTSKYEVYEANRCTCIFHVLIYYSYLLKVSECSFYQSLVTNFWQMPRAIDKTNFLHNKLWHSVPWLFLSLLISLRSRHASSTKLFSIQVCTSTLRLRRYKAVLFFFTYPTLF